MPQHTEDQVAQRRTIVASLYLKGWTQSAIAQDQGVSQGQISQDLKAIREEWAESTIVDFNEAKLQELAKIDQLEKTYWEAWSRSLEKTLKRSKKMKGSVEDSVETKSETKPRRKDVEITETTEERLGDPRYLDGILKCIQKRCELLGIDAPEKKELTGKDGKPLTVTIFQLPDNGR